MAEEEKDQKRNKQNKNREESKFKEQKAAYNSVSDVEIRMVVKIDSV